MKSLVFLIFISTVQAGEGLDDWNKRLTKIEKECLEKSYKEVKCTYMENFQHLSTWKTVMPPLELVYDTLMYAGRGVKETAWAASTYLALPGDVSYWDNESIMMEYANLKVRLKQKADRENLKDCQKACLGTCVTSKIMDYERSVPTQFQTCKAGVESGKGDCKSFANTGNDIMEVMGLTVQTDQGFRYTRNDKEKKLEQAQFHAVLGVTIEGKTYHMEPQLGQCLFFDRKFTGEYKPIVKKELQPSSKVTKRGIGQVDSPDEAKQKDNERKFSGKILIDGEADDDSSLSTMGKSK